MVQQMVSSKKDNKLKGILSIMKTVINNSSKRLSLLFTLIFIHSFLVGIALIFHPPEIMRMMGFHSISEDFFPVQGGIFHILMGIFYLSVVKRVEGFKTLIYFSIVAKLMAFVFLLFYYFLVDGILIVLVSGIADGAMALVIILAYLSYIQKTSKINEKE
jgi:hypothetical protein